MVEYDYLVSLKIALWLSIIHIKQAHEVPPCVSVMNEFIRICIILYLIKLPNIVDHVKLNLVLVDVLTDVFAS